MTTSRFFQDTPWGAADHVECIAPGVFAVSTPSHGGLYLDDVALDAIPAAHRAYAARWSHGYGDAWFEEDCAAACVVVAMPQHVAVDQVERARATVTNFIEA